MDDKTLNTNVIESVQATHSTADVKPKGVSRPLVALLVVLTCILALLGVYLLAVYGAKTKTPTPTPSTQDQGVDRSKPIKVEFTYKVKSITNQIIILQGKSGDFMLPYDPSVVEVYKGPDATSEKVALESLRVGANLNMEFIPGTSAKLFLSSF